MLEIIHLPLKSRTLDDVPLLLLHGEIIYSIGYHYLFYENVCHGKMIPRIAPELGPGHVGKKSMKRAMDTLGYCRRISKKKGFSDNPDHWDLRLQFVQIEHA